MKKKQKVSMLSMICSMLFLVACVRTEQVPMTAEPEQHSENVSESNQYAEEISGQVDYGREEDVVQNYLESFPQECDEILSEGKAVCVMNNTFKQTHLWEAFLMQIKAGQEACVVVMTITDEGDPILYYVHFDGTDYMVVMDTHRDHFGEPAYVKDKFKHMSEIRPEGTNGYQVVFANEVFQTEDESNAYWEKIYALYEEGEIDPNGENEYHPFPLTMINTVWERSEQTPT